MTNIIRFPIERRVRVAPRERPFFEKFEGLPDMAQIERWAKEAKLPGRFAENARPGDTETP